MSVLSFVLLLLVVGWQLRPTILRAIHDESPVGGPCSETVACVKGAECMVVAANAVATIGATEGTCLVRCSGDAQCQPGERCSEGGGFCGRVSTEGGACDLLTLCPAGMECLRAGDAPALCLKPCNDEADCTDGRHCTPMMTDTSGIPVNTTGIGIEARSYCVL